jgi:MFS family permease
MVSFIDRSILTLLVEPLKRDLHLTDVQVSLLMGLAFVSSYVAVGLPVARLADYKSRRAIMGLAVTVWSLMTAVCGLARTFTHLFLCLVGVGAGEGCSGPANYSMISDLFPREKLARAIAVVTIGFYAGSGLALAIGGTLTSIFMALPPKTLPLIGFVRGWQLTFFAVGLPGLLVAALMCTVREPLRRGRLALRGAGVNGPPKLVPIRDVVAFLRANASIYIPMFLGTGVQNLVVLGIATWGAVFYMRTFHWSPARYGLTLGVIALTVSPLGSLAGGFLAEYFAKKGYSDANLRVVRMATMLAVPGLIVYPLMPTAAAAIAIFVYATFLTSSVNGPLNAALQTITPNQMRGQVTAIFLIFFNFIGLGLGPTLVALYTQYVFHSERLVGRSMSAAALTIGPIAVLLWFIAMKPYARSFERAKAWS